MSVSPRDLLFYAGGECLQRFGTLVWRPRLSHDLVPTHTRTGSVGPFIGSDGVLRQASANRPRIEWVDLDGDGVRTALYRGELARTNELVRSEALDNASWTKSASSVTVDQATGPDGVASLDEIVESGTTAIHSVEQAVTGLTADAPFALSGFFRANTRSWVRLLMYETATPANVVNAWFNLTTGVVGTTGASGTGALVRAYVERDYVTGLYRPVLVGTIGNSATAVTASIRMATGDAIGSYAGDGSSSIYGGYVQMEDNATSASSYIATTTAAAPRNVDTLDVPIAFSPQDLTIYFDLLNDGQALGASAFAGDVWTLGRAASGNGFVQMDNGSSSAFRVVSVGASGASASRGSIGSGIEVGQRLRGIAQISSTFGVAAQYQIDDGATTTLANVTNADGLPADWAAQNLRVQIGRLASLKVAAGTKTMAEMRNVFPRAAS